MTRFLDWLLRRRRVAAAFTPGAVRPDTIGWDPRRTYTGDPRIGRHLMFLDVGNGSYFVDCYIVDREAK